jgi:feruloyl esterase
MRNRRQDSVWIATAILFSAAAGQAAAASCDSLAGLKLQDANVTASSVVAAGAFKPATGSAAPYKDLPEFCRVEGVIQPSADSHIEFEVWMPVSGWNNRYLGVGNGGFAGSIYYGGLASGLKAGYAVSSTDTGHKGSSTDAAWALGHFDKIMDYAYRGVHETSDKSKIIVRAFYGGNPKHTYFNGCSNGGRQALLEAQRYPADYDGIIAGAPANYLTHLVADFVWDMQALDESPATYISGNQLRAVESAAVAACDADDGVKDGVIGDPSKCHFDPAVLACKGAASESCLTETQIAALKKVYEGARNSKGELIHPGYVPGGESGFTGWAAWITGLQQGRSLQHAFGAGFFADMMFQDPAWDYKKFNFDRDMKSTDDKMGPIFNATDANLEKFNKRGGKLIIYHGWSDAAISPVNSVNYYNTVVGKMGRKQAGEFVELYMVPGMQHCGGGPGVTEFGGASPAASDPQHSMSIALERWVENGAAPSEIIATKYRTEGNPASGVVRTRPLCPYPQAAKYKGSGSTDDAANFVCAAGN